MSHSDARMRAAPTASHAEGQQHPIKIYLWIWLLLFVLSAFSYMVDYFQLQGYLRWTLIITLHAAEGRLHRRDLHARRLGTVGADSSRFSCRRSRCSCSSGSWRSKVTTPS